MIGEERVLGHVAYAGEFTAGGVATSRPRCWAVAARTPTR